VFEEYNLAPPDRSPTYEDVARRLGISATDVRPALFAIRQEIRAEIRLDLTRLCADPRDAQEEWHALFGE